MPPKPIIESICPVFPSDLFSTDPGFATLEIPERSAWKKLIAGTATAVVLIKSLLFIPENFGYTSKYHKDTKFK
jgi:hypothetical protein